MPGHRIGYVRVSSFDQNPELQEEISALSGYPSHALLFGAV